MVAPAYYARCRPVSCGRTVGEVWERCGSAVGAAVVQRVTGALLAFGSPWSRLRHLEPAASPSSSSIPSGPSVPREVARLALMTGRAGGVLRQRRTDARALLFRAR